MENKKKAINKHNKTIEVEDERADLTAEAAKFFDDDDDDDTVIPNRENLSKEERDTP